MIEVGDWIHVQPKELECKRINPTQLNKHKNRVQEPFFTLVVGAKEIMINGRAKFWALLDALFPDDPLPRTPVNEMLKQRPNDFLHDFNLFFSESPTPYISIMLGEIPDPYSTIGASWKEPGAIVITANAGLKAPDCQEIADRYNGLVIPGEWKDSKGNHNVPCVLIDGRIHIHDLGSQLVVGAVFKNEHGDNVRPLKPEAIKKGVNWPSILASTIQRHTQACEGVKGRTYPPLPPPYQVFNKTSLQMDSEHELFKRGFDY